MTAMSKKGSASRQSGIGLVEVMIAMVIGLMLVTGVVSIFTSSKQAYRFTDGLAQLQENGRFAVDMLSRQLRMAGYSGCRNLSQLDVNIIAQNYPQEEIDKFQNGIAVEVPPPGDLPADAVAGSDAITIRYALDYGVDVAGNHGPSNANVQVTDNPADWQQNDVLMITDCQHADVFAITSNPVGGGNQVTLTHGNGNNDNNRLSATYAPPDAKILGYTAETYYVANTGRNTDTGAPIRGLYRRRFQSTVAGNWVTEELVQGIDHMELRYGVDTNGDRRVDQYIDQGAVGDWSEVVSLRVALLASSVNETDTETDTDTYDMLGTIVDPADDRRVKKIFMTTVTLRNRAG